MSDIYLEKKEEIANNYKFTSCDDCIHKVDGYYQFECGECKRFYSCLFEKKEIK